MRDANHFITIDHGQEPLHTLQMRVSVSELHLSHLLNPGSLG